MLKPGTVYIMANRSKRLYTGVTSDLQTRVAQHKRKADPNSHTAKYGITDLVYYEQFEDIREAINREAQLKNLHRINKIALIVARNPTWQDLSAPWGKPAEPFDETKQRKPKTFNE